MPLELDVSPFLCEREVLPLLSELVGEPFWKFADFGEGPLWLPAFLSSL